MSKARRACMARGVLLGLAVFGASACAEVERLAEVGLEAVAPEGSPSTHAPVSAPAPQSRAAAVAQRERSVVSASAARPRTVARAPSPAPAEAEAQAQPLAVAAVGPDDTAAPDSRTPLEMTFVGDVIFGRYRADGYDPIPGEGDDVFGEVQSLIASDLLVGNLETPLVHDLPLDSPIVSSYRFGADATMAEHLQRGGFGAVSLANNHAFDMRAAGVEQTPKILDELGVVALGAARHDQPRYRVETIERNGFRIGFVAITVPANIDNLPGLPPLPRVETGQIATHITPLVEDARASHDLVVVLVHWGDEYSDEPSWTQRKAAHALVQAGADLVIGHHPHVLQGIERYGHGLIAYSLGNFVFENVKEIPRQTGVLRTRFDERGCLEAVIMHPAFVKSVPFKHPAPAVGFLGGKVKARIRELGRGFGTRWRDDGEALSLEGLGCPGALAPRANFATP